MKRLKNLSYLRVLACLGIVCTHLGQRLALTGKPYELTHYMQHGVYLFFIISGFLGLYTYSENDYKPWKYWLKRLARILPVYYAVIIYDIIVYGLLLGNMPPDSSGLGWLRYILVINQYIPGEMQWRNLSFTWTIGVFVLFYMMVPLINRLIRSYRASLAGLAVTYVFMIGLDIVYARIGIGREWFSPLFYIIYFMFGVVACRAFQEKKTDSAALIMAAVMLYFFSMSKFNSPYTLSCLFTIIILVSMNLEFKNIHVQNIFDRLDKYSYEIYLGHAVVMEFIDIITLRVTPLPPVAIILIGIAGTVLVSMALYHGVDKPVNKLIRSKEKC
ncbi:MAG: acyltransferase family protein [Bacteroides sp.]